MARLDQEAEEENKSITEEQEREVEELQKQLFVESVKLGSESLLDFYSCQ
jgi:hypothetical protein